ACFEEGLALCRPSGNQTFVAFYLEGLALVASAQGHPMRAAQLWGAAERVRTMIDVAVPPVLGRVYGPLVAGLQTCLGAQLYEAGLRWGRSRTLEQALCDSTAEDDFRTGPALTPAMASLPLRDVEGEETHAGVQASVSK